jgi:hypothetical protein
VKPWIRSEVVVAVVAAALCGVVAACGGSPAAAQSPANSPAASAQTSGTAAAATTGTPNVASTPSVAAGTSVPETNATPGTSASAAITPASVTTGNVTLDLTLQPARHMFDGAGTTTSSGSQPSPTPQASGSQSGQATSSAVFSGGMVGIANNIDPSQAPPADSAQSIVRHVVVHVKTKNGGQPVPYLTVTLDLLLDGHPVLYDQPLEPMTAVDKNPLQYYYGNNVAFPQHGTYQVFVRVQANPMLGTNPPPAAQFTIVLH